MSTVDSRQLVASSTELTGLVPRVGVIHFDVEADSDWGAQKLRVFILLLYSVFFADVCATHMIIIQSHASLLYDMTACVIGYVHLSVSVCRTLMPFRIAIRNLTVYLRYVDLRIVNFPRLCRMCIYFRT